MPPVGTALTRAARVDLYQDSVNDVAPGRARPGPHPLARVRRPRPSIDGTVTGVGLSTVLLGGWVRRLQTGYVRSYAASMLLGLVVLVVVVLAHPELKEH